MGLVDSEILDVGIEPDLFEVTTRASEASSFVVAAFRKHVSRENNSGATVCHVGEYELRSFHLQ